MNPYQIAIAGLLHDIGKLVQRADDSNFKSHAELTSDYLHSVDVNDQFMLTNANLIKIAAQHHNPKDRSLATLTIQFADWVDSGTERNSSKDNSNVESNKHYSEKLKERLIPIMSIDTNKMQIDKNWRYPIKSIDPDKLESNFPQNKQNTQGSYSDLYHEFDRELTAILSKKHDSSKALLISLYNLFEKYLWCVPSDMNRPINSLFDHSRVVAAYSAAHWQYMNKIKSNCNDTNFEEESIRFIVGDLSGIQSYIFGLSSKSNSGPVAKRLRARSFMVQQIAHIAALRLCHEMDIPFLNIIMRGGGKFTILAPNLGDELIDQFDRSINKWLYDYTSGQLTLNLSSTKFSMDHIKKNKWNEINKLIQKNALDQKLRPYSTILNQNGQWLESPVLKSSLTEIGERCNYCDVNMANAGEYENKPVCSVCKKEFELGRRLPKTKAIAYYSNDKSGFEIDTWSFKLIEDDDKIPTDAVLVEFINRYPDRYGDLFSKRWLSKHVPMDGSQVMDFETISKKSKGERNYLGNIKLDVDSLGSWFSSFLHDAKLDTLSNFASLSRMLDMFFSLYATRLSERSEYKDSIYTVFAGGDDLFYIGSWDVIIDFALKIYQDFQKFSCEKMTLSGGFVTSTNHTPIPAIDKHVSEAESKAKNVEGKDALYAFGHQGHWAEQRGNIENAKTIAEWQNKGKVSIGTLRKFLTLSRDAATVLDKNKTATLDKYMIPSKIAYEYGRHYKSKKDADPDVKNWIEQYLFDPDKYNNRNEYMKKVASLEFVIQYALLAKETGKEKGVVE